MTKEEIMPNETLHIAVSYESGIDRGAFADFESDVATPGLAVKTEERPESGPFAGLEWLIPTAVMVIIANPYFESFLSEAGKDHYHIVKKALVRLGQRFLGKKAPQITDVYTKGKAPSNTPQYSLVFSIYGDINSRLRLKLLIEPNTKPAGLDEAIGAFMCSLDAIHDGSYGHGQVEGLDDAQPIGGTILVTYNHNKSKLVVVDPRQKNADNES